MPEEWAGGLPWNASIVLFGSEEIPESQNQEQVPVASIELRLYTKVWFLQGHHFTIKDIQFGRSYILYQNLSPLPQTLKPTVLPI